MAGEDRGDNFTPSAADIAEAAARATNADIIAATKTEVVSDVVETKTVDDDQTSSEKTETTDDTPVVRDEKGRFSGIPKARFDEAVAKEREKAEAAQRQVAELQKQLQSIDRSAKVEDLEKQLVELRRADRKAIMDGDEEKSIELAAQIDRINRQIVIAESQTLSTQAAEEAREAIRTESTIERLEEIYPVLKEGNENFDQDLVDLVLAKQQQLITRDRMSPSQALAKAANDIMSRVQAPARVDEKPEGGLKNAKGAERATQGKQKNIDAALKTPPDTTDVGLDTDKAGMKDGLPVPMSVDDLKAIPESTLKRMRGDMI